MAGEAAPGGLFPTLAAIAVLALLMVVAMVRFSAAMLPPPPVALEGSLPARRWPPARRWGALYLLLWGGLIAAFLRLLALTGKPADGRSLLLLVGVAAAWLGFNALFIAAARALLRADARRAAAAADDGETAALSADDLAEEAFEATAAETAGDDLPLPGVDSATAAGNGPEAAGAGREPPRRRAVVAQVGLVAAALLVIAAGELIAPLQSLTAYLAAHQRAFLTAAIAAAAAGFALLMGGAIHLALTRGAPMSRREIEAQRARSLLEPGTAWRHSDVHFAGGAVGAAAEDEASFAEVKAAWRARAWRFSRRWRRLFAMATGGGLLACGLFGVIFVLAPAGIKLLVAGAVAYALVRTVRAFRRA